MTHFPPKTGMETIRRSLLERAEALLVHWDTVAKGHCLLQAMTGTAIGCHYW